MPFKLVVVEDDAFTRLTLVEALTSQGFEVVINSPSAAEAISQAETKIFDAAVLDLHLGAGPNGIDVAHAYRRKNPKVGIVFLTSFEDPRLLSPNLPPIPSSSQYLTKNSIGNLEMLTQAIRSAVIKKGESQSSSVDETLASLTGTQIEILRLVAKGATNAEIAKQRVVAEKSVEIAISRIAKALGLTQDASKNQRVHMAKTYFRVTGKQDVE